MMLSVWPGILQCKVVFLKQWLFTLCETQDLTTLLLSSQSNILVSYWPKSVSPFRAPFPAQASFT